NETTKTIENLDQQVQEQEILRQNARTILSIIQRTKVQLIELRPTMNNEADQKLKKIDDDLKINYELFEQSLNDYKRIHGNISDDLDKIITRVIEDMTEVRARFNEKESELNAYNIIRDEYENIIEHTLKIIQLIEIKTQQSHSIDLRQNLDLLKDLTNEMQTHRSLIDRLQLLSSTLSSQLIDTNERERVRRRLNDIIRRWTQLEQDIMSEEENMEEMKNLTELYYNINITCERWLKQTRDLINELTNTRNEHENQNQQQKDYRNRIESLFEWLKQTHKYEPLSDKRDLDTLQREYARLIEKRQLIDERSHDIDLLLRNIN
ncbi:unnamed protein product, partial [Rotaria sp. Silwood1]